MGVPNGYRCAYSSIMHPAGSFLDRLGFYAFAQVCLVQRNSEFCGRKGAAVQCGFCYGHRAASSIVPKGNRSSDQSTRPENGRRRMYGAQYHVPGAARADMCHHVCTILNSVSYNTVVENKCHTLYLSKILLHFVFSYDKN